MLLKYFKHMMLTVLLVTITGCITRTAPTFSIDELPDTTVGQNYSVVIGVWREFLTRDTLYWDITPINSGFSMRCLDDEHNPCYGIELYGKAITEGLIKIKIKSIKNTSIHKEYTIKVNP